MYVQRVLIYPQPGQAPEMQQLLESWVKTRQNQGGKLALAMQAFAPEGPTFVITIRLNSLADLEELRRRNRSDQAFREFQASLATLSRQPQRVELLETLVPFPS